MECGLNCVVAAYVIICQVFTHPKNTAVRHGGWVPKPGLRWHEPIAPHPPCLPVLPHGPGPFMAAMQMVVLALCELYQGPRWISQLTSNIHMEGWYFGAHLRFLWYWLTRLCTIARWRVFQHSVLDPSANSRSEVLRSIQRLWLYSCCQLSGTFESQDLNLGPWV